MNEPSPTNSETNPPQATAPPATESTTEAEAEVPVDAVAQAADREGFRFLAIGFATFFAIIAVCAGIVAAVMKSMGI